MIDDSSSALGSKPDDSRDGPREDREFLPEIGSVFLRGRVWYLEFRHHGVQHRESSHTRDKRKALKLLAQRHSEIARDEFIKPQTTTVTMNQLFDLVVADYQRKGNRSHYTLAGVDPVQWTVNCFRNCSPQGL